MGISRRRVLLATLGLSATSGCVFLDDSEPPEASPEETSTGQPATTDVEVVSLNQAIDILVHEHDDQFRATDGNNVIISESDDLGRVINEAQGILSGGSILVATDGSSRTEIGHEDDVVIGGVGRRTALTPAEDVDSSFDLFRTANGPEGGRLESFHLDMEDRGRSAIHSTGYSDVVFDDVRVQNTPDNGMTLSDGRAAEVSNCRFTDIGDDAIWLDNASDVTIRNCRSTGGDYGIHASRSSDLTVRGYRCEETRFNGVAIYDYTENWNVINCRAVDDGHTPFAASPALDGAFIGCVAVGTTADGEGGFEIEYKAGHDRDSREDPVEGCSVVSCMAIDCNLGFYAREDVSEDTTNTRVIRPRFTDCTAIGCETGLFIDDNVVEAIIREFNPIDCATDIVDNGTRTIIDGRSENAGDPATEGQWNGHVQSAVELDVTVEDTVNDARYEATESGAWEPVD